MKENRKILCKGIIWIILFIVWTLLVKCIDIALVEETSTYIGLSTTNFWFHELTSNNMIMYNITDWLGLIPIFVCMTFCVIGLKQLVKRKSIWKVDFDIVLLGVYYTIVIMLYLIFEVFPINYRPILIYGRLESSYPSSTTLLVLSVMPTLVFQINRRFCSKKLKGLISYVTIFFMLFMIIGRIISGVHWLSDIVGSILLSVGLFNVYKGLVLLYYKDEV